MAKYKYDISAISADINKLNALSNKATGILVIETQNEGDVIRKVRDELVPQLNELHNALNNLIAATATATQATLDQMIQLDDDFAEITEEDETIETIYVDLRDN